MNLNSFRARNLAKHLQLRIDNLRGLDFMSGMESAEYGCDAKLVHASHPSGNRYLERVLRDLHVTPDDAIIDIGCGKGSAMRTMLKFPFQRVDGLDITPKLTAVAERNFSILNETRAHVYLADATTFDRVEPYNIIYFYNPFPAVTMAPVMEIITGAARQRTNETIIIYNNPTCDATISSSGYFSRILVYPDQWRNGIFIFSNRSYQHSRFFRG